MKLRENMLRAANDHRSGLTLLEVILAIAILGIAMVALGQLVQLGSQAAGDARDLAEAQVLCDTKVSELRSGILPLQSASAAVIDTAPRWQYSVTVTAAELPGLLLVEVSVNQDPTQFSRPIQFTLVRYMPDPDYQPESIAEDG